MLIVSITVDTSIVSARVQAMIFLAYKSITQLWYTKPSCVPDISYICAPDSVRTFRIKLFVENVVEFFAKIRIFGGSSPRFSPLGTNANFTHVFTYGALTDGFARFT